MIARRLEEAAPDGLPPLVAEALAAAELGHEEKCRKAISAAARGSAEVRAMAALNALQVCRLPVWEAFGRAANQRGGLAADPIFVAACDEKGKDPVFTGPLASWRTEMEPGHYALFRALLPELHAALVKEGSSRARGVWSAIEHAVPALAAQLVAIDREAHPVPAAGAPPGFDRLRDAERWQQRRAGAPLVAVSAGTVSVDGHDVGRVEAILRKRQAEAWKLSPLATRLDRWRKDFSEHHPSAPPRDRIVLRPDLDVTYELLARVIYTAADSGFGTVDFAVPLRDRGFHRVRWSGQAPAPLVLALAPEPSRVEWEDEPTAKGAQTSGDTIGAGDARPAPARPVNTSHADQPQLVVEGQALVVKSRTGAAQRVADLDGKPDAEKLRKALAWLRKAHGVVLWVSVDDQVTYRRLLWALDLARESGFISTRLEVELPPAPTPEPGPQSNPSAAATATPPAQGADLGDFGAMGGSDKPKGPPPIVELEPVKVEGGLAADVVGKAIEGHVPEVRSCYAAQLDKAKGLAGRLVLQLLVGGGGAVSKALVSSSTLRNAALEECALKAAGQWTFPMPEGGVAVIVTVPMSLKVARR